MMSAMGQVERKTLLNGTAALVSYFVVAGAPLLSDWKLSLTLQTIFLALFIGFTMMVFAYPMAHEKV